MKGHTIAIMMVVGISGFTSTVLAGHSLDYNLEIGSDYARGSMKSVRNNGGSSDYIGCSLSFYGDDYGYLSCRAYDGTTSIHCFENSGSKMPDYKRALATMNSDSYIYFRVGSTGRCTQITIGNYSYHRE